jgi:hypothetical protein
MLKLGKLLPSFDEVSQSTIDLLVRALKVRTKELTRADALKYGADLSQFFALEVTHNGVPVRLIVCASSGALGGLLGKVELTPLPVGEADDKAAAAAAD